MILVRMAGRLRRRIDGDRQPLCGATCSRLVQPIAMNLRSCQCVAVVFLATTTVLFANPVSLDPAGQILSITFAIIVAVCIAIEVSLMKIVCRLFHDHEGDFGMTVGLVALNVFTWFFVLRPVVDKSQSVLLAEAIVVVVEAIAISRILDSNGVVISMKRALIYSASVNLASFLVGLLTQ